MQNVTFRNQQSQTWHTIIPHNTNRTQSVSREKKKQFSSQEERKNLKVEKSPNLPSNAQRYLTSRFSPRTGRGRSGKKEEAAYSEGLFARELVVELELDLPTDSKPEDTFRADNRTRNASTMPRNAWREHREFAIVRGGTGTWPGVRVQKEAPRGPFAHCRSYAPDRPLSISFFPPFFSTRPSRSPKDTADRPGRLVSACPPPG